MPKVCEMKCQSVDSTIPQKSSDKKLPRDLGGTLLSLLNPQDNDRYRETTELV
jgi:hypothetical protein